VSNTDFVNSGSYLRTVFVFISGMTTFTGFGGGTGFLGSGRAATGGGGGGAATTGLLVVTRAACLAAGAAVGWATGCDFTATCVFGAGPGAVVGLTADGAFPAAVGLEVLLMAGLDILDTVGFLAGTGTGFLAGDVGATFLTTGLAILLAAGAFLAVLPLPDEWAGLGAAFLAGAIFLTLTVFLAGFAAFFLVAIQLGFFSNEHF
jgi:hypothetical protein